VWFNDDRQFESKQKGVIAVVMTHAAAADPEG
jgi:hypothetical protein